jgi:Phycobilisome Linker polypeptide
MSGVTVPRPALGDPSATRTRSAYRRAQGREVTSGPDFTSDLSGTGPRAGAEAFGVEAVRALLGNAHVFESELDGELGAALGRYEVSGDVRELVREVAMSEGFRARFMARNNSVRFVEICFKSLLGRGPSCQEEVSEKIRLLNGGEGGYAAFVDSFVGCDEYDARFGAAVLPRFDVPGGLYLNGMKGFMSNMKVAVTTRGGNTDATRTSPLSQAVVASGEPAAPAFVRASYGLKSYAPFQISLLSKSSLVKEYSTSLVLCPAATSWSGLGTVRPHGPENGVWKRGWAPEAKGAWKAGWAPAARKY